MLRALALLLSGTFAAWAMTGPEFRQLLDRRTPDNPRPLPSGNPPPKPGRLRRLPVLPVDSVIRNDFALNDDTTGGCAQQGANLSVDAAGDFVVCWYEFRDGDADAWFQRYDSAGTKLGPNERLNSDITMGWQGDPAGTMSPDGRFTFSWEDRREIGNSDVFCQRFGTGGNRIGDNFRVSDSAADGDQSISDLHVNPAGTTLVTWDDRRFGLTGDIFAQFMDQDGQPLDTNFRVNDDPIGMANQYEPSTGGDDSGRFVVAWMDGRGLNPYDWNVFLQRFDSQRRPLGTNVQVTTNDSIQWAPSVGVGRSGRHVVCWDDRRAGNWDVYAQAYDATGNAVGGNFKVNDDAGTADQFGAAVAVNSSDEVLIAWTDRRSGNEDAYARRFGPDGTPLGPSFRLNSVTNGNQAIPSIGARPDGGYWVAWADSRRGSLDVFCRRLNRDGSPAGTDFLVNDDGASAQQRVSSIGMDARGLICVGWEDERNGGTDIYRSLLDPTGQPVGGNLRLNDDGPGAAAQYYTAVAGGNGRFLAAWSDGRADPDWDIMAQFMDRDGLPVGPNFLANSDASGAFQWYPYCAMDTLNNAIIAWMDTRLGSQSTFLRRYGPAGNPLAPESAVCDTNVDAIYSSVAMSRSGWYVAAWMDYREGHANAYCQLYRPDGSRVGPNLRCNADAGTFYHGFPACAVRDDGTFAVAWEDTRNVYYDVCLQWFDSTGTRLGENVLVNDGPWDADAYSPSCSFAPDGRLCVMFNDERSFPGCPEVFCQRFDSDMTRIGLNRSVSDAPLFPKNHHWTVGQSVAASNSVLAFAWTDNRRHQGFDIFGKLTDWDVVGVEYGDERPTRSLRVTPTVTRGLVRIQADGVPARLAVFDVLGRAVAEQLTTSVATELDLGFLARGTYFVRIDPAGGSTSVRVTIE